VDRPLIFVTCGASTAPLVERLAGGRILVLPHADKVTRLRAAGIDALAWDAFIEPAAVAGFPETARRLAHAWTAALERRAPALFRFAGAAREGVLDAIDACVHARLAEHLLAAEAARTLAARGLTAALVHEDVTGLVRTFVETLRACGVPTVHVPHGLYAEEAVAGADVHGRVHADVAAVAGAAARGWYLRRGVAADRVVVTGNPAFDAFATPPADPNGALGLGGGPVVTVAGSWIGANTLHRPFAGEDQARRTRAALAAAARVQRDDPAVRLVVKLHPSASAEEEVRTRRWIAETGARADLVCRDRLREVLAATDVLVTLPSTVVVEAMLAGAAVVAIGTRYEGGAVVTAPADAEAVRAAIARARGWRASAAFAAARRDFLARWAGPCDGRAGERVVALADALAARARAARGQAADAPPSVARRAASARARLRAGRPEEALAALGEAPPAAADAAAAWWTARGEALARLGRGTEAERAYRAAIAGPADAAAYTGLGTQLLLRGERGEAELFLREAVRRDPGAEWAWCALGVLNAIEGRVAEAREQLERTLALNPANPDARRTLAALAAAREAR